MGISRSRGILWDGPQSQAARTSTIYDGNIVIKDHSRQEQALSRKDTEATAFKNANATRTTREHHTHHRTRRQKAPCGSLWWINAPSQENRRQRSGTATIHQHALRNSRKTLKR